MLFNVSQNCLSVYVRQFTVTEIKGLNTGIVLKSFEKKGQILSNIQITSLGSESNKRLCFSESSSYVFPCIAMKFIVHKFEL